MENNCIDNNHFCCSERLKLYDNLVLIGLKMDKIMIELKYLNSLFLADSHVSDIIDTIYSKIVLIDGVIENAIQK